MSKSMDEIRAQVEMENKAHEELLSTLIIPEDDPTHAYTNRVLEAQWVKAKSGNGITGTTGWTAGAPQEVLDLLGVGDPYILETNRNGIITGWIVKGTWYARKSDQDLEDDHRAMMERIERDRQELLDKNREQWQADEAALPDWLKERLQTFHERGGETFLLDGWGYELMVCRLAEAYAKLGDVILNKDIFEMADFESDEIKQMARDEGTSGNQHSMALALAKRHLQAPESSLAGTPSALSPLTGEPFYEKKA